MHQHSHQKDSDDKFDDLLGGTLFLYGCRSDWNDMLDIIEDESSLGRQQLSHLRRIGKLISEDSVARTTEKSAYTLMMLTESVYDDLLEEATDGSFLLLMITELRKKTGKMIVRGWLAPEHSKHPELTRFFLRKCFKNLLVLKERFPDEIKTIITNISERNWLLAKDLSSMGYEIQAKRLQTPVKGSDGVTDYHEYIARFS